MLSGWIWPKKFKICHWKWLQPVWNGKYVMLNQIELWVNHSMYDMIAQSSMHTRWYENSHSLVGIQVNCVFYQVNSRSIHVHVCVCTCYPLSIRMIAQSLSALTFSKIPSLISTLMKIHIHHCVCLSIEIVFFYLAVYHNKLWMERIAAMSRKISGQVIKSCFACSMLLNKLAVSSFILIRIIA